MGARWNRSRAANRRVGCRPGKSRRDIEAQVVDPTQARIAASGWSRGAPRANQVADAATALRWCAARSIEAMHMHLQSSCITLQPNSTSP